MSQLTEEAHIAMANALELAMPACDGPGNTWKEGACIENGESGKGYVYYSEYESCMGSWILLPGFNLLPDWLLGITYILFLTWIFFGVAVVSDVFVESIEVITGTTRKVKRKTVSGKIIEIEVPVWNWVVSNITLMALGSSSPEILLAIVEAITTLNRREAEELGASCIIGSASFNLFMITAVCTISLPNGVFKKIDSMKVFTWTTIWMLWAHIWLWMVYKKISPGEVEIWEGLLTLGYFPIFVFTAWLVDTRGWNWLRAPNQIMPDVEEGGYESKPGGLSQEKRMSILHYRQLAVQQMRGHGKEVEHIISLDKFTTEVTELSLDTTSEAAQDKSVQKVMFKSPHYSCLESVGVAAVQFVRIHGDHSQPLTVYYKTEDNSAVDGLDYVGKEGKITFGPNEDLKEIEIKIVDDDMSEPDVAFFITITSTDAGPGNPQAMILQKQVAVTIVDDDDGGILTFELPSVEAGMKSGVAEVTVVRRNGADGKVTVDYCTRDGSALAGTNYREVEGSLEFNPKEIQKIIEIPLLPQPVLDPMSSLVNFNHKAFKVCLKNPGGGAVLGARSECRVILVPGGDSKAVHGPAKLIMKETTADACLKGGCSDEENKGRGFWMKWRCRFKEAIIPDLEVEDEDESLLIPCLLHYLNISWNLIAAFVPPAEFGGGYLSFFCSLVLLTALMAIVSEVAGLFGCVVGLSQIMVGISIVAAGTSLPDTFASRMAAIKDDNADQAIGNITASNCVNIFLGLGIPWTIASIYKKTKNEIYLVSGGALGFCLLVFFVLATVAIVFLFVRRSHGGELGGSAWGKGLSFTFLLGLWLLFLMLAGLYTDGKIPESTSF